MHDSEREKLEAVIIALLATLVFAGLTHVTTENRKRSRRELLGSYRGFTLEQIKKELSHVDQYKAYRKDTVVSIAAAVLTVVGFVATIVLLALDMGAL
ncbi:MAG: hypothetical protein Q8P78_02420 [bacterium]|nr:hypothetical protein [bacterium]